MVSSHQFVAMFTPTAVIFIFLLGSAKARQDACQKKHFDMDSFVCTCNRYLNLVSKI